MEFESFFLIVKRRVADPFYKNSLFILMTLFSGAVSGFLFWTVAAKLFVQSEVGIATAIISTVILIVTISRFGFDQSIIRYFPDGDKDAIFSTSILITTIFCMIFGVIFIVTIPYFFEQFSYIENYLLLFFLLLFITSLNILIGIVFIAMRSGKYQFYQSILTGSRILFLFPLIFYGTFGILFSYSLAFIISLIMSAFFLLKLGLKLTHIDFAFLKESFHFSLGNYLSGILLTAPMQIMPLIIIFSVGAETTATFYITFTFASLLFMIPNAITTSLFVEGSHGESIKTGVIKSISFILILLIPSTLFFYEFGLIFLKFIGKEYILGFGLLKLFILSSFLVAIVQIYFSIKKIKKEVSQILIISSILFILILGLSIYLLPIFGLVGIGYAWILSYLACVILIGCEYIFLKIKNRYLNV